MAFIGLDKKKVKKVVNQLDQLLADYHLHYQKLRNFHWNVSGENFFDLHTKFEEYYDDAKLKIDEIAERILKLDNTPTSNVSDYLKMSSIKEAKTNLSDREMVNELIDDVEILISKKREVLDAASEAKDEGTIDMVAGFLEQEEQRHWMLSAWAKTGKKK